MSSLPCIYKNIELYRSCSLLSSSTNPANPKHQDRTNMSTKVSLSSRWCLTRNELVISFPDWQTASDYQRANPEGRIYTPANKEVYIPRPEGLIAIRSSSQSIYSLVLEFASEEETNAWHRKILISSIFPDHVTTRAYLHREVKTDRFMGGHAVCCEHSPTYERADGTEYGVR